MKTMHSCTPALLPGLLLSLLLSWPASLSADTNALASERQQGRTLEDFFTAAMEHSPHLRIAEDRLGISEARRQAANGQLLPQISATASISENRQRAMGDLTTYRGERYAVQLRQVLFDWQRFAARGRAYATENQSEAEYYGELAQLFADVADFYFEVLEAEDSLTSVEAELRAIRNQLSQTERLHSLQMAPITDLYDVQARVSVLEAERLSLESDAIIAREALRAATGLGVGSLYSLGDDTALPTPEGDAETWSRRAETASHQIAAREFALEAADQGVSESRSRYMPQLALIVQQQRSDLGFDNRPNPRTDTGYVGIDLTIPLFAGGSNRAAVSEAMSQRNIASNELRQTRLEVGNQARMLYLRLQANELRMEAAERTLESMIISATSRERAFELGNVTSVDVLDALRDRFRAERDLQALRYDHIKLSLRLRQTAGTLDADDMLEVSGWLQPGEE